MIPIGPGSLPWQFYFDPTQVDRNLCVGSFQPGDFQGGALFGTPMLEELFVVHNLQTMELGFWAARGVISVVGFPH